MSSLISSQQATSKGLRPHISIFGTRNAGKSSLLNRILGQSLSIVSPIPGTTTDPVSRAYELQPVGPVMFIDTAGIDDEGELGAQRIEKSNKVLAKTDIAIQLITPQGLTKYDRELIDTYRKKKLIWFFVINKQDISDEVTVNKLKKDLNEIYNVPVLSCSALLDKGIWDIKDQLVSFIKSREPDPLVVADLVKAPSTVVLVTPIDAEAPKGRMILPQAQVQVELLDAGNTVVVCTEKELEYTLTHTLKHLPDLVITDSQAFEMVAKLIPEEVPLTSFSILFARQKGDIEQYTKGLEAIDKLKDGDTILILELCSHAPIGEDIGRIKIPKWLQAKTGLKLNFETQVGNDVSFNPSKHKLIVQCGGCVVNRQEIMSRLEDAKSAGIPITNYGVIIAYINGITERVLQPLNLAKTR
jgi:[FeFe] hydrogenase H-cluster maturation GTPase HydF